MKVPIAAAHHQHLVVSVLDFGHSHSCVVVSYRCFNLKASDDIWCTPSFHILTWHLISFLWSIYWWYLLPNFKLDCLFSYCEVFKLKYSWFTMSYFCCAAKWFSSTYMYVCVCVCVCNCSVVTMSCPAVL